MLTERMNRRALLLGLGAGTAALMLAGCATTKDGHTTTVTLNVAKITAYAQLGLNAAVTVTDALALFPSLASYIAPVQKVEGVLKDALANFTEAAGSNLTVSYNDASIKAAVDSVLADIQSVASEIATIILAMAKQSALGLSDGTVSKVQLVHDALTTIIAVFRALLTTNTALAVGAAPRLAMSEAQAVRVLRAA
ncbi:MAG TPA: hypothetical protein VHL34_24875 [Rhizomicrobium sp.]|jgi:hypothetical protein|nr:hypothetical protein [Rhizomicrobium sp.]